MRTKQQNINSNIMQIIILMVSFMLMINNAVLSPILGNIQASYPNVSDLLIQGVLTLPAITIIIAMFLSGWLVKYLSPRIIISIGFLIYIISGVILSVNMPFQLFIVFRLLFGFGVGLTNPFVNIMIVDYFSNDQQTKLMGYSTSARVLGGTIATGLAGIIASFNWHLAPMIYMIAIIPLITILIFMDNEKLETKQKSNYKIKDIFDLRVVSIMIIQIFVLIIEFVFIINISLILSERNIAAPELSSILIIVFNIATMLISMLFFKLYKKYNYKIMYASLVCGVIAFLIFAYADNYPELIIASIIVGLPGGLLAPLIIRELGDAIKYPETTAKIFTAFAITIFVGQFLSPIIISLFKNWFHFQKTSGSFLVGIIFLFINLFLLIIHFKIIVPRAQLKK